MNPSVANLVPLPVLIPLLAAAATLIVGRRPRVQRWITVFALVASLVVCVALLYYADATASRYCRSVGGRRRSASRWSSTDCRR